MELIDLIIQKRPNLSQNSVKAYTSLISNTAKKLNISIDELLNNKNTEKVLKYVEGLNSNQTKKSLLSALFIITNNEDYKTDMLKYVKEVNDAYKTQKHTDERLKNLISFDKVREIVDDLKSKYESSKTFDTLQNYVIALTASGVLEGLAPRRLDWVYMKVKNYNEDTDNYIKRGSFVFNKFKTAKSKGQQKIKVPKVLVPLIKKLSDMTNCDYLFVNSKGEAFSPSLYSQKIKSLFGVTQDLLRSIFLSNYYKDIPKLQEMEQLAENMGNSINSQLLYYVKKDD
jgi:hypothetical protein